MSPTAGSVSVIPNLCGLLWNIGQKFTGRNLEVALPAEVYFHPPNTNVAALTASISGLGALTNYIHPRDLQKKLGGGMQLPFSISSIAPNDPWAADVAEASDPFLVGTNSYAKVFPLSSLF
jgi:hypothetical protein